MSLSKVFWITPLAAVALDLLSSWSNGNIPTSGSFVLAAAIYAVGGFYAANQGSIRSSLSLGIIVGLAEWVTALAVYTLTQPQSHADGLHDFLNPWLAIFVSGTGIAVVFALVGGAVSSARGRIETLR